MLGDSVSQQAEIVQGDYGAVFFKKSGPLCLVRSSFVANETPALGRWIVVCIAPAWVAAESFWLAVRDSQGHNLGIWSIVDGAVKMYLYSKPPADNKIIVEGLVMTR